jgi:hypothetical protein
MLERLKLDNAVVYQSPLLRGIGVPHAFGTRHGDSDAIVDGLGLAAHGWVTVKQVHGGAVTPDGGCEADAVVLNRTEKVTRVITADCVPVLLATLDGRRVAAVHAGWRGLLAGVMENAVQALGAPVLAAVGPAISAAHFEVGTDVADRFDPAFVRRPHDSRPHVDLPAAAAARLKALGARGIDRTDRCTYRDAKDFFSHRRDVTHHGRPTTGRMANVIACKQR